MQVDEARRDPAAFKRAWEAAKEYCKTSDGNAAPAGWMWVACDDCQKWRLVSKVLFDQRGLEADAVGFVCKDNTDRHMACCEDAKEDA